MSEDQTEDWDREALEAELWLLRSKEYDTEALRQELEESRSTVIELYNEIELQRLAQEESDKKMQVLNERNKKLEKDYTDATADRIKAIQEKDYLTRKLEAIEKAEYMSSTYGFEVAPSPSYGKKQGWRLTQ